MSYRPLESLIPYARNARTHSDAQVAQIAASIRAFGWTNPILVDGENGIIAGHGRVLAARKLGMAKVPVIELAGMSEAEKRAYIIADNKLAENAGWDQDLLGLELGDLAALGFDLSLTGFGEDEIASLTNLGNPGLTDPDDVPEVEEEVVSRLGDVWLLGRHRLVCGDSTNADDVALVPGRGEAASDGLRSALWRELRSRLAGAAGRRSWNAGHRHGAQRRPRRLAGSLGPVPRRCCLCLACRPAIASCPGEPGGRRLRRSLPDHLGQDPAGDRPRRLSLAA